jgi:hypothetical protein
MDVSPEAELEIAGVSVSRAAEFFPIFRKVD